MRGGGGEPVSFARTIRSHGCATLPPARIEGPPPVYRRHLRVGARIVEVAMRERAGRLVAQTETRLRSSEVERLSELVARMFRLSDDLSPFYALLGRDDPLHWATQGAGRILASPSVFEDVIKTICTTNCTWSATQRMTAALTELGGGAFPEPQTLASTPPSWYAAVARMGYRGAYVRSIAKLVASGALDLEALRDAGPTADDEVERRLLELPGIGPYAAAHVMLLLGRYGRLVLDSWTRPKYLRLTGRRRAADSSMRRAFARYGPYAGLAFWLFLTRDWIED